jgi:hypothetical protein
MLPDAPAPFLLVLLELGLAQLDDLGDLLVVEVVVANEGILAIILLDDTVVPEDTPYHVLKRFAKQMGHLASWAHERLL